MRKNTKLTAIPAIRFPRSSFFVGAIAAICSYATLAQAQVTTVIYQDDFSGDAADDLGARTPTVSATGASWTTAFTRQNGGSDNDAVQIFSADGTVAKDGPNNTHNAGTVLPLELAENTVYTLEATFLNDNIGWIAVGFASTDNILQGFGSRHANGNANAFGGYAWGLSRNNPGSNDQELFNGIGTGQGDGFVGGANGGAFVNPTQEVTFTIILDTTDTEAITAEYLLNGFPFGGTQTLAADAFDNISLVGISTDGQETGDGATGSISSFSLTSVSDEVPILLGDANLDNMISFADIGPFIALLSSGEFLAQADVDESGDVDFADISPFIAILSGS